jgi:hypothetical protein
MNDDWRLRVEVHSDGLVNALTERLRAGQLEHEIQTSFHDRVIVSSDGPELFSYAGTREQAERVEQLIRSLAQEHGWSLDYELKHWHPTAEEWEDPDVPLPASDADRAAERAELMQREREESVAQGSPDYEVRVECPSHRETVELAEKLRGEGLACVQRWRYLLVGAADEDSANALAERLRAEAPAGSKVIAEGTFREVLNELPPSPFSIFGGLGG